MNAPCQQCGRHATFVAKTRHNRITGDPAHDLCRRCFRKLMDAVNAAERTAPFRTTTRYWQQQRAS